MSRSANHYFTGASGSTPNYIEEVFSTFLYTGNGSTQTITNGIDLSGNGGLVWLKSRSQGSTNYIGNNLLYGSAIGYERMYSNTNNAAGSGNVISVSSTGFTTEGLAASGYNGDSFVSWTFRKQKKFFDVVTYTGNGTAGRTIAHNLGSEPGCMIVKVTNNNGGWQVYHRSLGATKYLVLDDTVGEGTSALQWNNTAPTSSVFTVGTTDTNESGRTYVAYLFAHNAGGFGLTGTDNVISCGTFTPGAGGGATVTLGWEPQWVLVKATGTTGNWTLIDTMRNYSLGGNPSGTNQYLRANTSGAELEAGTGNPTATGFFIDGVVAGSQPHIYIAIRRGPMKVPTDATKVFTPLYEVGTGFARTVNAGFPTDLFFIKDGTGITGPETGSNVFYDRLRGNSNGLLIQSTGGESVSGTYTALFNSVQNGVVVSDYWSSYIYREYCFKRAPGFFDQVCYTGTGTAGLAVTHNLTVVPELMIVKGRNNTGNWGVYTAPTGNTAALYLQTTGAVFTGDINYWNNTSPTSTQFTVGVYTIMNGNGINYVAYLFATLAGVSKVGSYTGTGTTLQVNCGFTAGARFVLIKRTDDVGDWYVWDSARGIVAGNEGYLFLNSTAGQNNNNDYIDPYSPGFELSSTAPAALNANGGNYIFLAIA